jgi:hypothetical protein
MDAPIIDNISTEPAVKCLCATPLIFVIHLRQDNGVEITVAFERCPSELCPGISRHHRQGIANDSEAAEGRVVRLYQEQCRAARMQTGAGYFHRRYPAYLAARHGHSFIFQRFGIGSQSGGATI